MEIWLDTCDSQAIAKANTYGIIYGVTTNPSLLGKVDQDPEKVINALLDVQDGPVAVQVTATNAEEIIQRALALHSFSGRILVKVPVTGQGLIAIRQLSEQNVPIMATAVFHTHQALLAAKAGAVYVAPYIGRMIVSGIDAFNTLMEIIRIYKVYNFSTKVIAAALQTIEQITACAEIGVPAVTIKVPLFAKLLADDPLTEDSLQAFASDWENNRFIKKSILTI